MKICWQRNHNVVCFGRIFNDGFGAIVMVGKMQKPWIWKVRMD